MKPVTPNQAEDPRLELARTVFRDSYAQCFWFLRRDLQVTAADIPEIVRGLRQHGGRRGFLLAEKLCR